MLLQAAGFAVLAGLSPTALLITAIYLGSARPRTTALCYLAGAVLISTVMGIAVLLLLRYGHFQLPGHRTPRYGLRIVLVVGLIIAIAAFFSGPSVTAVSTRGAFKSAFDWLRRSGEHAGVSTGPVGRWTYTHRRALRITAVIIASLVFVFWGLTSWVTAVVIAIVLLIVLGLIELIGRPPAQPQVAAQPSG